ncbi:MAG: GDP-mannose 4,6-dehydratase, partial [Candidatus Heimdallarchaeota archaeon]|nr:GDP-mannose 4,6-dehydratase [Candidatus Heimdallarchaeota archaeon]
SSSKVEVPDDVTFIQNDIQNKASYENLPKIDFIVHAAAQISINQSVSNPIFDAENNILGTLQLLEYAKEIKTKRFIHISSAATYGDPVSLPITEDHPRNPKSPYGLSKLVSERYVRLYSQLYNLEIVVLIPFNIYSPLQNADDPYAGVIFKFVDAIKKGVQYTIYGDGKQTRDFIHVKDVARAIDLSLKSKSAANQIINIGSGVPYSINELSSNLLKLSKSGIQPQQSEAQEGDIYESYCSIKKAQEILGFTQSISIETGLSEILKSI